MHKIAKIALGIGAIATLSLSAMVVQAGGWDNFKLRYFSLTQHLQDQNKELSDLQAQNIDPEKNTRIDLSQILNGGPPKDGIPSIDNPKFDTGETTPFGPEELVIGVVVNGEAKAYPYGIMNWHEIVNDKIGGVKVSVSYCPLCDTMLAVKRGNNTYGVSGKLYQSCLLMYDRASDSLYAQPWGLGVVGSKVNQSLERIPAVKTTLSAWLGKYPKSKILSTDTGYRRNYQGYPYGSYNRDKRLVFPVRYQDQLQHHPKEIISYLWEHDQQTPHNQFSGTSLQFVHAEIKKLGEKVVPFNGRQIRVHWDKGLQTAIVSELDGTIIPSSTAFAFVYPAFFGDRGLANGPHN